MPAWLDDPYIELVQLISNLALQTKPKRSVDALQDNTNQFFALLRSIKK